ncbi:hypothetical protein HCA78_11560 [Listeria booriae]|uniref:Uncharacterized protein n=1 Tax=Listeria booriae TaxID=1552123 RepID=A0A842CQH5_9LIST|nr:hypothetical protein [Listeria booriae]MBC2004408.1 hypothetical protein [Listeria booriae]MBC2369915.1 hypothetical protein [Listeria booriae]
MAIFIVNMSNGNLDLHVQVVALNEVEAEQLIKKEFVNEDYVLKSITLEQQPTASGIVCYFISFDNKDDAIWTNEVWEEYQKRVQKNSLLPSRLS